MLKIRQYAWVALNCKGPALCLQGRVEGEGTCGEMIALACKNVTEGTASDDFCLDFCFFSDACEE